VTLRSIAGRVRASVPAESLRRTPDVPAPNARSEPATRHLRPLAERACGAHRQAFAAPPPLPIRP
jgi:hypothetical protein